MATALITGASSGLGKEFALLHARAGDNLIVVARRQEVLRALKEECELQYGVTVHVFALDLTQLGAVETLYDNIKASGLTVDYLINNAGFGGFGLFWEREKGADLSMIDLNVRALTELTRLFLPAMVSRGNGKIMNLASVAAYMPGPLQAVYFATKAYVLSFSEALMNEVKGTGVSVTCLCPGATATGFEDAAKLNWYDMKKQGHVASAEDVARFGYTAMMKGRGTVVYGARNRFLLNVLVRLAPRSFSANIARKFNEKPL